MFIKFLTGWICFRGFQKRFQKALTPPCGARQADVASGTSKTKEIHLSEDFIKDSYWNVKDRRRTRGGGLEGHLDLGDSRYIEFQSLSDYSDQWRITIHLYSRSFFVNTKGQNLLIKKSNKQISKIQLLLLKNTR